VVATPSSQQGEVLTGDPESEEQLGFPLGQVPAPASHAFPSASVKHSLVETDLGDKLFVQQ